MKTKEEYLKEVRTTAEECFRRGEFFCSEAVLHTINNALGQPLSPEITKLASGFPVGLGKAQCLCGAISGGEMALGLVYGRVHGEAMNPKMFEHAKGLHDYIKKDMVRHVVELLQRSGMVITLCLPKEKNTVLK